MDVANLEGAIQQLFSAGLAPATQQNYRSGARRYLKFCEHFSVSSPYPASEQALSGFVAYLFQEKLASSTIKNYLSAIRYTQIALGLGDPNMRDMRRLEYVVKGVKRLSAGGQGRTRLPITPSILRRLKGVWESRPAKRDAVMLWAATTTCFFGFLRAGEVVIPSDTAYDASVHLSYGDVRVDCYQNPRYVEIRIKCSKTDPFRRGVSVYLGATAEALCPVAANLSYMVQRGTASGPFFVFQDGRYLTRDRFVAEVRAALTSVGMDCSLYAGHSFRIGAATTAAQLGVQDSLIKTLGRWESSAYMLYVRTPRDTLCAMARKLAGRGQQN